MNNLGTFFYAQGLRKVLVEILREMEKLKKVYFSVVLQMGILQSKSTQAFKQKKQTYFRTR
jgi:hypothetical protein